VRARVMVFEGWHFGCIVADDTNPKRFLMENRFGFDWLMIGFVSENGHIYSYAINNF